MKLERVTIRNYRAIEHLTLPLDPSLTVLYGDNAHGKTSVLSAIAGGLGSILTELPEVSGVGFRKTDRRRYGPLQVELWATDGVGWIRRGSGAMLSATPDPARQGLKQFLAALITADRVGTEPLDLPIVAFYDANRAVFDAPQRRRGFKTEFVRYAALEGALAARTDFREFFKWFYAKENEELREQKKRRDFDYRSTDLSAVRNAIQRMVPSVSSPRIELGPLRFVVTEAHLTSEVVELDQLSGGFRIMLALAADLARRMAQGNPHLPDPLASEAIVLIDEAELHLHPAWQQRVLGDLGRTFPKAQFIVSTHSPQVLTTVRPEQIAELRRTDRGIVAEQVSGPTYGAEAGDVLAGVMGVSPRPGHNEFVEHLARYMELVEAGEGESASAIRLRSELEALSPHDPDLNRADIAIRRHKVLRAAGRS